MYAILIPSFPIARLEKFPCKEAQLHPTLEANPICVWHQPPGGGTFVLKYGHSRVEAALRRRYPYLPAIVSGPGSEIPEFQGAIPIDLHENPPLQFLGMFRNPPHKWWVHPSGHLEFAK